MRIACVHVPQLALQAVLRRDPEQREGPVALADGPGERARIVAMTEAARRLGLRVGLTVSQARGVMGGLRVVPASAADAAAAQAALQDVAYGFAPRIESEHERVFLEVGDLQALYPHGERAIAQALAAQAARVGLAAQVAIAATKPVARAVAMATPIAVVPAGHERALLAGVPLPVALAGVPGAPRAEVDELGERLGQWGVTTLGTLAALPGPEVTLRLGPRGTWLHQLATGVVQEPFAPRLPPDALEEGTELDWAIHELEPLAFVLRGLLDRALDRLACRSLACASLTLRLALEGRAFDVREIPLAAPTRESATLLQLVRLDLARRPPSAPVVGVTALVLPARVRGTQLDMWRPTGPTPEKLAATLARLGALVGPENVGVPGVVDTFREEAIAIKPYELRQTDMPVAAPAAELALGFRRFRPPQPVEVLMDRDGPSALRGRSLAARVMIAAGPYRISGEWWSEESFSRDYWDVQASDGAVYRVHQDRTSGSWFLDGYYD